MTQNYHTPLGVGAAVAASTFNAVFSDLDAGITANVVGTGNNGEVLISDSSAASGRRWADFAPADYLAGFEVSVSGGLVTVQGGICRDQTGVDTIKRTSSITIDPLSVGLNGIDSGALGFNTWYRVWVIKNPTSGSVGGLLSASDTPLMPSGYTLRRRVGWARTGATAALWRQETLTGRRVLWIEDTTINPFSVMVAQNVNNGTWDTINLTQVVPPSARLVTIYFDRANAGGVLRMRLNNLQVLNFAPLGVTGAMTTIPCGPTQTFEITSSTTGAETVNMQVQGYIDDVTVV